MDRAPRSSHPGLQPLRLHRRLCLSSSTLRCTAPTHYTVQSPRSRTLAGTALASPSPRGTTTPPDTRPHSSPPAHALADSHSSVCRRLPSSRRKSQPAAPPRPHCSSTLACKPPSVESAPCRCNTFPEDSSDTARCWKALCGCYTSHVDTARPPGSPGPLDKSTQQGIQSWPRHSPPRTQPPCPLPPQMQPVP